MKFTSDFYDGSLKGKGRVDIVHSPFIWDLDFVLRDVSPCNLESILTYFSKINGKLDGHVHYISYPRPEISGKFDIYNGDLHEFEFFEWLAGFFKIPSLNVVDFQKLSGRFLVNHDYAQLEDISLQSEDVTMEGYFRLFENDLVASKLSLELSREILEASPKFKLILKLLGKEFSSLKFDFQLSGLIKEMNFKWLDSYFKKRLRDSIPDFIERGIERKIENILYFSPEE